MSCFELMANMDDIIPLNIHCHGLLKLLKELLIETSHLSLANVVFFSSADSFLFMKMSLVQQQFPSPSSNSTFYIKTTFFPFFFLFFGHCCIRTKYCSNIVHLNYLCILWWSTPFKSKIKKE